MSEEKIDTPEKMEDLKSLHEFIEINQKMIAVIGVFVAVGLFWKSIYKDTQSIPYISYLCFLITIPLFLEVRKGYDSKKSSWNLKFFVDIFSGILLLTFFHLLTNYTDHLESLLYGVIWALISFLFSKLIEASASLLKDWRYKKALKYQEKLIAESTEIEIRNKLITKENKSIKTFGELVEGISLICLILSLFLSFLLTTFITNYIHIGLDVELQREIKVEVPAPDVNSNTNINSQ